MNISKELNLWMGACVLFGAFLTVGSHRPEDTAPARSISAVDAAPEQPTSHVEWRSVAHSTNGGLHGFGSAADTLLHDVRAGDVLIIDLPEELNGRSVTQYVLVHAPALSWLVDYSLMWRTMPADTGRHNIVLRAGAPADTLVVSILVREGRFSH